MPSSPHSSKLPAQSLAAEPVHQRLAAICRQAIIEGRYKTGEKFSSERELAENFQVSRATANKVISALIAEGLLELRPGIGTFVGTVRTFESSLRETKSFTDQTRLRGMTPSTRVLDFQFQAESELPSLVAAQLRGDFPDPARQYLYFERLRLADGEPLIIEQRWTFADLLPSLKSKDLEGSFYHLLDKRYGIRMNVEAHSIAAVNLEASEAELLHTQTGNAALMVVGGGYREPEEPIWYQRLLYRGDRYVLANRIQSERNGVGITVQFRQQPQSETLWQR